ncbi:low molecular weight phosphotyrosine protein phosphatase 1 [Drosophila busckii]|uniref:low molecular weight phosphotyrosine protein phosphatase 1 n=1 Tax=Drosophila busckii TaxID=30019 RepID=UPI00083F0F1F|nr:low molecular weight phosphotyrosine protein phosphatase 1 [Drosophila busckii]
MVQKILMICLGNICRSPIAEVVMADTLTKANRTDVLVDSAALGGWHVGNRADPRALSTLEKHGLKSTHIVRQITKKDFQDFDYIFGMDEDNMKELRRLSPQGSKAELLMLGDFGLDKSERIIEDPYYERGAEGFETAYQKCVVSCGAFMKQRLQK